MSTDLDPRFSDGLRAALVAEVSTTEQNVRRRRNRWLTLGAPAIAIGIAGSGVALAVQQSEKVPPGQDIVTPVSVEMSLTTTGDGTLVLSEPPAGSSAIEVTVQCHTAGTYRGPGGGLSGCSGSDLPGAPNRYPVPGDRTLRILSKSDGFTYTLRAHYVNVEPTAWGVNANGETYGGHHRERGEPDLIAVGVDTTSGNLGYVRRAELYAAAEPFGPTSPAHALRMQREREAAPPGTIPVYESDGVTVIGSMPLTSGSARTP